MMDSRLKIGIAGDDCAHALLATWLADQATCTFIREKGLVWPEVDNLDQVRVWVALSEITDEKIEEDGYIPFMRTGHATELLKSRKGANGRAFYRSPQREGGPAAKFRPLMDTIKLFEMLESPPDALLVLVDEDGDSDRVKAVCDIVREHQEKAAQQDTPMLLVAATTIPTAEAWLVALIAPTKPELHKKLKDKLSFDPVQESHRLISTDKQKDHHAKRVLAFLLDEGRSNHYPADTPKLAHTRPALEAITFLPETIIKSKDRILSEFYSALLHRYAPMIVGGKPA